MAKADAPFLSLNPSGKLGRSMVASRWKGQPYIRMRVTPKNPRTAAQQEQRGIFADAVKYWQDKDDATKKQWDDRAKELGLVMSGFNFYVSEYIKQKGDPTMP